MLCVLCVCLRVCGGPGGLGGCPLGLVFPFLRLGCFPFPRSKAYLSNTHDVVRGRMPTCAQVLGLGLRAGRMPLRRNRFRGFPFAFPWSSPLLHPFLPCWAHAHYGTFSREWCGAYAHIALAHRPRLVTTVAGSNPTMAAWSRFFLWRGLISRRIANVHTGEYGYPR